MQADVARARDEDLGRDALAKRARGGEHGAVGRRRAIARAALGRDRVPDPSPLRNLALARGGIRVRAGVAAR